MLIFDQLRENDPRLRAVAVGVLGGLGLLLAGLWWVQIVLARDYQESLETQSFRTVRLPAVRGEILDRNGAVLAENRPVYNVSLYFEELRKPFDDAYFKEVARARAELEAQKQEKERELHRALTRTERKQFTLATSHKELLRETARFEVASEVVTQVGRRIGQPLVLDAARFEQHYRSRLALPYPILTRLDVTNLARFEEQSTSLLGVDLQVESMRVYPYGTTAAHVLGHLKRDDDSKEGEEAFFSYWLPDYRGLVGVEWGLDKELRGMAGAKSVLVNNVGYRQTENVWRAAESGRNVVLTIDLGIQQAAELALKDAPQIKYSLPVRGAAVVMDVETGDILAMASSPILNPNSFIPKISEQEMQRITEIQAERNLATQENYMPGSIFKTVVGLAALEAGWDPEQEIMVEPNPAEAGRGCYKMPGHTFRDTAPPGLYSFIRALEKSCNSYFIRAGLFAGPDRIIKLAQHLHFGERTGLPTCQEVTGSFPKRVTPGWNDISTGNLSIGQSPVWVTPLQIAVMFSALGNGGHVLWPRLVDRIESRDPTLGEAPELMPHRPPRDELVVSARSMKILHDAMLRETEDPEGTGHPAALLAPGMHICGKTGTAQVQDVGNHKTGQTTWFASFAPYEHPRYAVVVMVEDGASGGGTCAPVAGKIYHAIMERDRAKGQAVAKAN